MYLPLNCMVVILEGIAKVRELPEHGKYQIVMHQGKIKRMRKEEGNSFDKRLMPDEIISTSFDETRKHRFHLSCIWDLEKKKALFIMLNPS